MRSRLAKRQFRLKGTLRLYGRRSLISGGGTSVRRHQRTEVRRAATVSGGTWTSNGSIIVGDTGGRFVDINSNGAGKRRNEYRHDRSANRRRWHDSVVKRRSSPAASIT